MAPAEEIIREKGERRPNAGRANRIPEDYQANLRKRLRQVREGLGILKTQVKAISDSSLTGYENRDISTMKLGDLHALSQEYGWSMAEMAIFLFGSEDMPVSSEGKNGRRMNVYLRSLPVEQQDLACDILRIIVDHNAEHNGGVNVHQLHSGAGLRDKD